MYEVLFSVVDRCYTVGYHDDNACWHTIKECEDEDDAVATISLLNGGTGLTAPELRLWLEGFDNTLKSLAVCVSSLMVNAANLSHHFGIAQVLLDYNLTIKGESNEGHRKRTVAAESRKGAESPPDLPELRRPSASTDA